MKKHIVITILLSFVVATAEAQLLYRISEGGLKEPSFMLGTVHNLPGSLLDSIPEYAEAQINHLGVARFYGTLFLQYMKYGFGKGPLEKDAYKNEDKWRNF